MKCVATDSLPGDIPVNKMKDGELGEVTSWSDGDENVGQIVQRYDTRLIFLGQNSGHSWPWIFDATYPDCRVRLIKVGETIKLVE